MNKKGAYEAIQSFIYIGAAIFVALAIWQLTNGFIVQKIDIADVESKLLTNRILFSSEVNYFDEEINRLYIVVVDLTKFNSEEFGSKILNEIYYGKINSEASAKLTLKDLDENKEYVSFYNEELYNEKKVLVEARLTGIGSARRLDTNYYVLIKDGNELKKGVLNIDAILPNG